VLGALLVVIVGMRVEVLKLGSSVGRQLEQATALESGNAALRAQVSELSGNQRIEQLAATMGMLMPGPMDIHFVRASAARNVDAAIRGIHAPASQTFLSGIASERQTDANNTVRAADTSAVGVLSSGTVATSTTGTSTAGTTSAGTTSAGTTSVGAPTSGTPTTGTGTYNGAATNTSTAGTDPGTTDAGSTSTATGSGGAVSNTSGTTAPNGPTTGGAALGG
jgi:hypothetical protein